MTGKLNSPTHWLRVFKASWRLMILAGLTAASVAWCLSQPASHTPEVASTLGAYTRSPSAPQSTARPIQDIRLGQRVLGENPLREQVDRSFPEPTESDWRRLEFSMFKPDGKRLDISLLRPLDWIEANGAVVGESIHLQLPELGVDGSAEVLAIEPCPPIEPGEGQVVTGLFRHESSHQVLNVSVEGESKPIGVTANHPFWSEDRHEFVPAGELRVGETLETLSGTTHITSISPRGPPEPVYNLEVHGEHVYQVAQSGVLVHNACGRNAALREAKRQAGIPVSQQAESQLVTAGGIQYVYNVPKSGGGNQTYLVTEQLTDSVADHGPHFESGAAKLPFRTDFLGRLRVVSDKIKIPFQ